MPEKASLGIALPTAGFRRFMFFNRFAVEREEGFVHVHFGLITKASSLADAYSTAISELELSMMRPEMMSFLGSSGPLLEAPPPWQPPAIGTEVANHMVMARHGP